MRERIYLTGFLLGAGLLLYIGRALLIRSDLVAWSLTFGGTTAAGVLGLALYRVQLELRQSRRELARKQTEIDFARDVQQALFPRSFPEGRGLEFSGICIPASGIGGDYYDVVELPGNRLAFAIADISGKGISAAILMSNLHAVLRTLALAGGSPEFIGEQLNRHIQRVTDGTRFATLFYAVWNPAGRRLDYINAGHNAPLLFRPSSGERLPAESPPLGIVPGTTTGANSVALGCGDLLVLFSDGVTEAGINRENEFGESRLESVVASCRTKPLLEIQERVVSTLRDWTSGELEDDVTLLLVRATGSAKETA